jgi:PAS domain-containing protein
MRSTVSSRRRVRLLYAGVLVFAALAVFTVRSIYLAWHTRSGEAKAEAVLNLVAQRTPPRPTEAPGAMAWLRLELDRYEHHIVDPRRAALYRSLAAPADRVPDVLAPAAMALRAALPAADDPRVRLLAPADAPNTASLRQARLVQFGAETFVVTRRRRLDAGTGAGSGDAATASNRFVRSVVPLIAEQRSAIDGWLAAHPLPAVPDDGSPKPVRLYAVSEDGTLVSEPWDATSPDGTAVTQELALLGARPGWPTFAPQEFFFRFDPAATSSAPPAYSGFYLDLGGRGLVSTITLPIAIADGQRAVLALDLAFQIDWQALASRVDSPVVGSAVRLGDAGASWSALDAAIAPTAPATLRQAVSALATNERRQAGSLDQPSPLRHGIVPAGGAVAAFQVSDSTWLLMFFPNTAPAFPTAAVVLLAGMLAVLLAGFEVNRRRADDERQKAERALAEKQNLLNTMQVPLVVVDPNSDVIVSANRAAESIGIRAGSRFADLVWPDERSRAHYEKMQVASPEPRRAYGLSVAVRDDRGVVTKRYAVVRSVAVTAPIEALAADERHRLGVLFVLDAEDDLALFAEGIDAQAHRDERRRLAGLLSHGVDTLARVLEHCLAPPPPALAPRISAFAAWLAEYLERRLTVTAWLLDHWDATPPLAHDHVVDVEQVRATLARLATVLELVRDDRELRSQLHWDNGTLAVRAAADAILEVQVDWPSGFDITSPVRGGLGMFLGEVVTNAVRHGRPGSVPRVEVRCDPVRREIAFRVENLTASDRPAGAAATVDGDAYGGVAILRALARLFEWRDLTFRSADGTFVVEWRVPASVRGPAGQAD